MIFKDLDKLNYLLALKRLLNITTQCLPDCSPRKWKQVSVSPLPTIRLPSLTLPDIGISTALIRRNFCKVFFSCTIFGSKLRHIRHSARHVCYIPHALTVSLKLHPAGTTPECRSNRENIAIILLDKIPRTRPDTAPGSHASAL